ncbi:MAG: hypothetical protein K0S61_4386 [Anaerocolumna sp.]|nr:hypothetical protein [Anaerocolumna sp.]
MEIYVNVSNFSLLIINTKKKTPKDDWSAKRHL